MPGEFLDTNVLVYAHDVDAGRKHTEARDLVLRLIDEGTGLISVQVLQEFFVAVTKKIPSPLDADTAEEIIEDLGAMGVFSPQQQDVVAAIHLVKRHRISFWDAMIIRAAVAQDASIVWSEDLASGQTYAGVTVRNPFVRPDQIA
jgi:predicted nucleic acid-binding protein